MRLRRLQLLRYGKFTDTEVDLPRAEHDFHFIVGPNEAGKSTLRGAIGDLLFGLPLRSGPMAFLHPQPDLRLGATVEHGQQALDFFRIKANKATLRDAADAPLADDALSPFMDAADRDFFEQMFGLDHGQLVKGGESILDASEEVSQVLFQSAAGIDSLGKVRDALTAEADKLWAPRAAASRTYYAASSRWEDASRNVKQLAVRTKVWTEARAALTDVESRIEAANARRTDLQAVRGRLERIRRLAPSVHALNETTAALAQLGDVLELPADAGKQLSEGMAALSRAETVAEQRASDVTRLAAQCEGLVFDGGLLAHKEGIEVLQAFSQRVQDHYDDLDVQQRAHDQLLALAQADAAELGWPADETALRATLPHPLVVREVQRLVTAHGECVQSLRSAQQAVKDKRAERADAEAELQRLAPDEVSPALRAALSAAQASRNTAATQSRLDLGVAAAERALDAALAALGPRAGDVASLQRMAAPAAARLSGLVAERQRLVSARDAAAEREAEAKAALDTAQLAVGQFEAAGHVVTGTEVRDARVDRDKAWSSIRDGAVALALGAPALDAAMALADELVDTQLGSVNEAARLQSLRQQAERLGLALAQSQSSLARKAQELGQFDQQWADEVDALGLAGLAPGAAQDWFAKRETALSAASSLDDKRAERDQEKRASDAVGSALRTALASAGVSLADGASLLALVEQAEAHVARMDAAVTRRELLAQRLQAAASVVRDLEAAAADAEAAHTTWQTSWATALAAAGLTAYVKSVDDAEQAQLLVERVRANLTQSAATKRDRIDTMRADLARFEAMAQALVTRLGQGELASATARDVVRALVPSLREAEAAQQRRAAAQDALQAARENLLQAQQEVQRVHASVGPLLAAAGVETLAAAIPLVECSDRRRQLLAEAHNTRTNLAKDAEGLTLDAVLAEVQSCDLAKLPVDLAGANESLETLQAEHVRLAEERLAAQQALDAIDGRTDAASAESQRQEALADMVEASERYLKVATAVRLLGWAIDRYRDEKQGPMLARAGSIFRQLTLGRYTKLFVDYDKTPVSLSAHHADGRQVEVSGLSEGTRDQLYLALRLAALELHLQKAKPLPFIADDLFINFDDERSTAGLEALRELSTRTQVLFLSHHDHLLPRVKSVFGDGVNVVKLQR
ncbi:AAA family ATPase [Piscinibacter sp. Jin2]|uniref:AAA family ATPase n=1 Tax=Aquariibacter lacus TaxID=2801332 RepID=A0A9X0XHM3_9BURK|nr:YhaN family protein [Piscinibacter lacus]MBL0719750.1 AAA family ATPase [Piscinibacter lacus]